jgi:parallel beta-helix repeat protein
MSQLPICDTETNKIIKYNQSNWHQWNGHEYQLIPIDRTWLEASADCEMRGGHLVTIATEEENNFVASLVSEAQIGEALIGFTDQETEGEWQWVTGEPVTYTKWDPGEPADAGQEDYAGIGYDGSWPDLQVYEARPYVCEWDTINVPINLTDHSPIIIENDDDFSEQAITEGWVGNGTPTNPYIIEGFNITSSEVLIHIENTNVHFILRDNFLSGIHRSNSGIYLVNITQGTVRHNLVKNCRDGIHLEKSSNVVIDTNEVQDNMGAGIWLITECDRNIISNNTCFNNGYNGIELGPSAGSENIIIYNTCFLNSNGIWLCYSSENEISNNYLSNNSQGVELVSDSNDNTILGNTIYNNTGYGIYIVNSHHNQIYDNYFIHNGHSESQAYDEGENNIFSDNYWDPRIVWTTTPQTSVPYWYPDTTQTVEEEQESTDQSSTSQTAYSEKIEPFVDLSSFLPLLQRGTILFFILTVLIVIRRRRPK